MNKTIKLLCTWAAGMLLTGCGSEADMTNLMDWQNNPDAVHFTASLGNATPEPILLQQIIPKRFSTTATRLP